MSYPRLFTTFGIADFATAVDDERRRQLAQWGDQRHPDGTGSLTQITNMDSIRAGVERAAAEGRQVWANILGEEVAEVLAESDPAKLRAELVQVAAVCAAWISDIDRRPRGTTSAPVATQAADHG